MFFQLLLGHELLVGAVFGWALELFVVVAILFKMVNELSIRIFIIFALVIEFKSVHDVSENTSDWKSLKCSRFTFLVATGSNEWSWGFFFFLLLNSFWLSSFNFSGAFCSLSFWLGSSFFSLLGCSCSSSISLFSSFFHWSDLLFHCVTFFNCTYTPFTVKSFTGLALLNWSDWQFSASQTWEVLFKLELFGIWSDKLI